MRPGLICRADIGAAPGSRVRRALGYFDSGAGRCVTAEIASEETFPQSVSPASRVNGRTLINTGGADVWSISTERKFSGRTKRRSARVPDAYRSPLYRFRHEDLHPRSAQLQNLYRRP